jgi:hypothetical protein
MTKSKVEKKIGIKQQTEAAKDLFLALYGRNPRFGEDFDNLRLIMAHIRRAAKEV